MSSKVCKNILFTLVLLLTIVSCEVPICNNDVVNNLPGYPTGIDIPHLTMYSGFIPVNSTANGSLFYWFIESMLGNEDPNIPIFVWLNGGPGASSLTGLLAENGPFRISDNGKKLTFNEFTWVKDYHMLFVDNPIGTGFSFCNEGEWITKESQMADNFVTFLLKWFNCSSAHEKYSKNPLFLSGESYAGRYIPWIAHEIIKQNVKQTLNLHGLVIGNGIWNPFLQFPSSAQYAYNLGIINKYQKLEVDTAVNKCLFEEKNCTKAAMDCETVTNNIYHTMGGGIFQYNVNKLDEGIFDDISANIALYLGQSSVQKALHTLGVPWKSSDGTSSPNPVNNALYCDIMEDNAEFVNEIISNDIRILFYNGQLDGSICNNYGNQLCLNQLNYSGNWEQRPKYAYQLMQGGKNLTAGYAMESEDKMLTYFVVSDSGHLVPYDQPENILKIIYNWVVNGSWNGS